MLSWHRAEKPIIALSPMADMTDSAFCRIAKRCGAGYVFREMISAVGINHENPRTLAMSTIEAEERPVVQQIFGPDPDAVARAIETVDRLSNPDAFDINMGCPAHKITDGCGGSALMKEPSRAAAIVRAAKAATPKQVSVKTRLGWSDPTEILDFACVLEEAGADLLTIHGRTKTQGYAGRADWAAVGRAWERVSIPGPGN